MARTAALAAIGTGLVSLSGCGSGGSHATTTTTTPMPISAIPTVTLNNGVQMPMIAIGSGSPHKGYLNGTAAEITVRLGLKVGLTHIDTAHSYLNQDGVSRAVEGRSRDSFFLTTKIMPPSSPSEALDAYNFTMDQLEDNLVQLNMSFVDLVEIHMPPEGNSCKVQQEQWRALEDFYKAGKAKAIGTSNYCVSSFECLEETQTVVPMVNQIEYHVGLAGETAELLSYAKQKNIQLMAYSPLASDKGISSLITGNLTKGIGLPHNKSGAQAALKWILQSGVAMVVGGSSEKHLRDDIDMFNWDLTDDDMATFDAETTPEGYHWAPCDPKHPNSTSMPTIEAMLLV